ncbi:hypothetical protein MBLNU230_g0500t1 [Neophaeotheca triangularis]
MDDQEQPPPSNTSTLPQATHNSNALPESTYSSVDPITAKPSAPTTASKSHKNGPTPLQQATSSIKITHETRRSIYTFLLHKLLRPFGGKIAKPRTIMPEGSNKLDIPKKAYKHCTVEERRVEGIWVYDVRSQEQTQLQNDSSARRGRSPSPRSGTSSSNEKPHSPRPPPRTRRMYYYCGGGWQMSPSSEHWSFILALARRIPDLTISIISYPLAPNSPASSCFSQLYANYTTLLAQSAAANEHVILGGDSSGGNLALCLPLHALRSNSDDPQLAPLPSVLFVMAPSTDLRRSNPAIPSIEPHDPILRQWFVDATARAWRGDWDAWDPRVSPLNSDLTALQKRAVKVHGLTGGYDILSPDAVLFREKCRNAGIEGEWLEWDKQMHCFPLAQAFKLPESVGGFEWVVKVLSRA